MRILFVTPYVPSLVRVRPLNFLKQLSARNEVTLVSLAPGDLDEADSLARVSEYCEKVHVLPLSRTESLLSCCRRLFTSMPLQAAYTRFPAGRDFVAGLARSGAYDVLHIEHIRGAHLADGIEGIPKVYDSVDCITRLLNQLLDRERGLFSRSQNYEELMKMRSYEARVAAEFDRVVVTSEPDRRALLHLIRRFAGGLDGRRMLRRIAEELQDIRLGLAGERVSVVRNGVDTDYFRHSSGPVERGVIAMSGKMSYSPNASAALAFYKVFRRIREVRPEVRFRIIGSDPTEAVKRLAEDPSVEVTGYVPDIRPHLASAEVIVCPLAVGVGIQNKVLEAMAMGKPVVATPVACKGIPDAVDGLHLVRAHLAGMAEAVLGLLPDPDRGRRLGEAARELVVSEYGWDAAARSLEEIYRKAAKSSAVCAA
ncbi:MAG: glycosyltransferase [Armatimonadota bacterium]